MKKISLILLVILLFVLSGCKQEEVYTKQEVDEIIEVIIIITENELLTYENGMIIEINSQTGSTTNYTIKEYLEKRSD